MIATASRRSLLGGIALPALLPAAAALARTAAPATPAPAVARLRLGRVTVTFLSDGFIDAPAAWFTGAPPAELARLVAPRSGPDGLRLNITAWLVDDGERLTLIDGGTGGAGGPTTGRLLEALRAVGVAPGDVDLVAVTHTHFDHIAGLFAGQAAAFPNAELLAPRADIAHFTDPARRAAAPDVLQSSFAATARLVAAYPRLQRIDGERAITPRISSVNLSGHTPGHTGFRVGDGGQSLMIVGDALVDPALHPRRDDLGIAFEADPAAARAMRAALFPRASAEGALLAATHMPFPGLGRIERDGGGLRWAPADFPLAA